jgi:hypothetical protein
MGSPTRKNTPAHKTKKILAKVTVSGFIPRLRKRYTNGGETNFEKRLISTYRSAIIRASPLFGSYLFSRIYRNVYFIFFLFLVVLKDNVPK